MAKAWKTGREYRIRPKKSEYTMGDIWITTVDGGYHIDWDGDTVFVTFSQAKKIARRFLKDSENEKPA